jgi:hypothetical protein
MTMLVGLQIILLYDSAGPFAMPNEPCPFRCIPVPDEQINTFDEVLASLVAQLDKCDACMKVYLPKQLRLDDGAEDLLEWFKETSGHLGAGANPQRDTQCAPACCTSSLSCCAVLNGMQPACTSWQWHAPSVAARTPRRDWQCVQGTHGAAGGPDEGRARGVALHVLRPAPALV